MIASLHNKNKEITIPGFYNDVEVISKEERDIICWKACA